MANKGTYLFVGTISAIVGAFALEGWARSKEVAPARSESDSKHLANLESRYEELQQKVEQSLELISALSRTSPPVGTISAFAGEWPPSKAEGDRWTEAELGWMLCDGREFEAEEFPELKAVVDKLYARRTDSDPSALYYLPDLRGEFLRGLNYSRMVDTDVAKRIDGEKAVIDPDGRLGKTEDWSTAIARKGFCTTSDGAFDPRNGDGGVTFDRLLVVNGQGTICNFPNVVDATPPGHDGKWEANLFDSRPIRTAPAHRHKVQGGDQETRPRNVAVNYIIKVRP